MLKRKRPKGNGSQALIPEEKTKREAPVERLWERNREGRKETNRKLSTGTGKESMRDQAGENGENGRSESGNRALRKPLRGGNRKKGKGRTEGQVAGTGREADERKRNGRGKPESESIREAPEEQLWERIREG